jgi:hypothetical protein
VACDRTPHGTLWRGVARHTAPHRGG